MDAKLVVPLLKLPYDTTDYMSYCDTDEDVMMNHDGNATVMITFPSTADARTFMDGIRDLRRQIHNEWIFTFGTSHGHTKYGLNRGKAFVVIRDTFDKARKTMFNVYGERWSHQYPTREDAGVDRWGLVEIELGE